MTCAIRRSVWGRWLAVLCALFAPGAGGAWLQAAHPCAVAAPWMAADAAQAGHHGAHASPSGASDTAPGERADAACHCIGDCLSAVALPAAPTLPVAAFTVDVPRRAGFAAVHARLAARLRGLLPPATAPPLHA